MKLLFAIVSGAAEVGLAYLTLTGVEWAWNILLTWSIISLLGYVILITQLNKLEKLIPRTRAIIVCSTSAFAATLLAMSGHIAWAVIWAGFANGPYFWNAAVRANIKRSEKVDES